MKTVKYLLNNLCYAIFSTLIFGIILESLGNSLNINLLIESGKLAKQLLGPAIGVAVGYSLNAKGFSIIASVIIGTISTHYTNNNADILTSFVVCLIMISLINLIHDRTGFDLWIIPFVSLVTSVSLLYYSYPYIDNFMDSVFLLFAKILNLPMLFITILLPFLSGLLNTIPFFTIFLLQAFSFDIAICGIITIGTSTFMMGLAFMSLDDNDLGVVIATAIGSSIFQFSNIIHNLMIIIPPMIASFILGPIGYYFFKMFNSSYGASIGTTAFIGQVETINKMGALALVPILLLHILLPILIVYPLNKYFRKRKWIRKGDMKIMRF